MTQEIENFIMYMHEERHTSENTEQNFLIYIKLLHIANPDFFRTTSGKFFFIFSENFYQFLHDARIYITFRHYADKKESQSHHYTAQK